MPDLSTGAQAEGQSAQTTDNQNTNQNTSDTSTTTDTEPTINISDPGSNTDSRDAGDSGVHSDLPKDVNPGDSMDVKPSADDSRVNDPNIIGTLLHGTDQNGNPIEMNDGKRQDTFTQDSITGVAIIETPPEPTKPSINIPPTVAPTVAPTEAPTTAPTEAPTVAPTEAPTTAPTEAPTTAPTETPTETPTEAPTTALTTSSTTAPTEDTIVLATETPTIVLDKTVTSYSYDASPSISVTAAPTIAAKVKAAVEAKKKAVAHDEASAEEPSDKKYDFFQTCMNIMAYKFHFPVKNLVLACGGQGLLNELEEGGYHVPVYGDELMDDYLQDKNEQSVFKNALSLVAGDDSATDSDRDIAKTYYNDQVEDEKDGIAAKGDESVATTQKLWNVDANNDGNVSDSKDAGIQSDLQNSQWDANEAGRYTGDYDSGNGMSDNPNPEDSKDLYENPENPSADFSDGTVTQSTGSDSNPDYARTPNDSARDEEAATASSYETSYENSTAAPTTEAASDDTAATAAPTEASTVSSTTAPAEPEVQSSSDNTSASTASPETAAPTAASAKDAYAAGSDLPENMPDSLKSTVIGQRAKNAEKQPEFASLSSEQQEAELKAYEQTVQSAYGAHESLENASKTPANSAAYTAISNSYQKYMTELGNADSGLVNAYKSKIDTEKTDAVKQATDKADKANGMLAELGLDDTSAQSGTEYQA